MLGDFSDRVVAKKGKVKQRAITTYVRDKCGACKTKPFGVQDKKGCPSFTTCVEMVLKHTQHDKKSRQSSHNRVIQVVLRSIYKDAQRNSYVSPFQLV